ncbi:MAG: CocE/NonD family hydrolase [Verrucomicrobia bacterium]|nr:CocE/NonD family hydrolase [Verrucomicrobiota bacterium]
MKIRLLLFAGLMVLALGSQAVGADDKVTARLRALFAQFDANRDGVLSPDEQIIILEVVNLSFGERWGEQVAQLFKAAASADGSISEAGWKQQVEALAKQVVSSKRTFRVAMRDGVKLATDVYLPPGEGPFPVILARTPYGRSGRGISGVELVQEGIAVVVQDMRGRFDSEGENLPFIGCGWGEHQDGVDTVAWLRQQPWCNGTIGTVGGSAGGITQNLLAGATTNGVVAQYIAVAAASLYHDAAYTGGAFRKADVENWTTSNKFDPKALLLMRERPGYDDYWRQFDSTLKFATMTAPAVHVGGWFDMFAQGTIDEFVGRHYHGGPGARGRQQLVMGPWEHGVGKPKAGELTFPNSRIPKNYDVTRWFEFFLLGRDNGVLKQPAVAYYVMGDTATPGAPGNEWRFVNDWPVPAADTPYYFQRGGKLSPAKPTTTTANTVTYTFDPANPCPTIGGGNLTIPRGPRNQNPIESRPDVVMFTSEPLSEPVEVTGRVKAKVFVSSSAVDTDLSVRLCDVYPDGKSYLMAEGMLRLRHRKSFEKPELLTPGKIEEVTVDCWSTSIIFNKGHRIRVTVTSSNYPRFDVNPGTGKPWTDTGERVRQTNKIHCDVARPSCVLLPIPKP